MREGKGSALARRAAAEWGLAGDAVISLLCVSENATYQLTDPRTGARFVLRLNRPGYHSYPQLRSELAWIAALRADGVLTTPAWHPTLSGEPVATFSAGDLVGGHTRHGVLFDYVEGVQSPSDALPALMPAIGEIAARLHTQARRWTRPRGFTRFAWDVPAALGTAAAPGRWGDWRVGASPGDVEVLSAAACRVTTTLGSFGQQPDRYGLVHADLRAANVLVPSAGGDQVAVIDFDDCAMSWYGYDLAASLSFVEHQSDVDELAAGWLDGYRRAGRFDAETLVVLPSLVMLRRLQLLAWTATHADTQMARSVGASFGAQTAYVADQYLRGQLLKDALNANVH